jgi:alpha-L-fucosidase
MKGYEGYYLAEFTYPMLGGQKHSGMRGAMWFYSLPENDNVACTAEKIYADYLGAEKYGNIFSLDVGPDRDGRIRDIDVRTLKKVGQYIRGEIKLPPESIAKNKPATASTIWDDNYTAGKAFDGNPSTRWGAEEGSRSGWLQVDLEKNISISRAMIKEGSWDRIRKFELQIKDGTKWQNVATGTTVGASLELTFTPRTARYVRLNITEADEVPTILELELFETNK